MDLFEIGNNLLDETQGILRVAAVVIAIGFFLFIAIRTKFAWAPMLLGAAAAAFVLWVIGNVNFGRDVIDDTIRGNTSSAPAEVIVEQPATPAAEA